MCSFFFFNHLENERILPNWLAQAIVQKDTEETPGTGNAHYRPSVPMVSICTAAISTGLQGLMVEALHLFLHNGR